MHFPFFFIFSSVALADQVVFLEKAEESLQARYDLISTATQTIEAQYYNVDNDRISISSLALLREAARRGVQVRILVDSMNNLLPQELMGALLDSLTLEQINRIQIREYNSFNLLQPLCYTRRMHDKALIIDGNKLIVGDRNVANGYYDQIKTTNGSSVPLFEGMDVMLKGNMAGQALKYFNERWNSEDVKKINLYNFSHENLHGPTACTYTEGNSAVCEQKRRDNIALLKNEMKKFDNSIQRIQSGQGLVLTNSGIDWFSNAYRTEDVHFLHDQVSSVCRGKIKENNIGENLFAAIEHETKQSLMIVTPYLVVTPQMEAMISKLIRRGVRVRFITNSMASNDVSGAYSGYLKTREKLLRLNKNDSLGSVKIYEYSHADQGVFVTLHAKMVLIDNSKVFIGSYNWDFRSEKLNSEVGVLIGLDGLKKSSQVHDIRNRLADILKTSQLMSLKEAESGQDADKSFSQILNQANFTDEELNSLVSEYETRKTNVGLWNSLLQLKFLNLIEQL